MLAGYAVLQTDCDVIWLRNPTPYLMCPGGLGAEKGARATFECAPLLEADVAVSSDNMTPGRDTEGRAGYSAGGTFNTGILFIRATEGGRRFASEWHRLVVAPDRGSRFSALTSDQQVFNNMMRKPLEWPGISAPHGASVMTGWGGTKAGAVKLGALPMALFMNGHGYFVQVGEGGRAECSSAVPGWMAGVSGCKRQKDGRTARASGGVQRIAAASGWTHEAGARGATASLRGRPCHLGLEWVVVGTWMC